MNCSAYVVATLMLVTAGCHQSRSAPNTQAQPTTALPTPPQTVPSGAATPPAACSTMKRANVVFKTDDGVTLQADYYPSDHAQGAAVILLHMIPPNWDRSSYPSVFIDQLIAAGFSVLNVDRRGAGGSGGIATEAYVGAGGALDVKAAVGFLAAQPCRFADQKLVIVGASNGTTSALDYAVLAQRATPSGTAPVAALVFLSPGPYTEKQNPFATAATLFKTTPILFMFPDTEAAWPRQFQTGAPAAWQFLRFDKGAHGTSMFEVRPVAMENVVSFIAGAVR
jgi:pimeloyl-ACP methyl ester carboxylesterase